jgi:hypothetical protein
VDSPSLEISERYGVSEVYTGPPECDQQWSYHPSALLGVAMTKNKLSDREERIRTAMQAVPMSELITKFARTDPEYAARVNSTRAAAAPILAELDGLGYKLETLAELRHLSRPWKSALPVLLRWLPLVEDKDIQEEIVRSLSVPWIGNKATQRLIDLFRVAPSSSSLA